MLAFLVHSGADVNTPDQRGWTPLDYAGLWNQRRMSFLESFGARPGTNRKVALPVVR